jgi:hypothetical protein
VLREYVGPYALQRSFKEMELSMYYRTEVLQRPDGVRDWVRCLISMLSDSFYMSHLSERVCNSSKQRDRL